MAVNHFRKSFETKINSITFAIALFYRLLGTSWQLRPGTVNELEAFAIMAVTNSAENFEDAPKFSASGGGRPGEGREPGKGTRAAEGNRVVERNRAAEGNRVVEGSRVVEDTRVLEGNRRCGGLIWGSIAVATV